MQRKLLLTNIKIMKLYKQPELPTLMKINIYKNGFKTEHIHVEDAEQQELLDWLKKLIENENISIFETGKVTTVEIIESISNENGKAISFGFRGLDPKQVEELIINNLG